jgi:hypothetical protein
MNHHLAITTLLVLTSTAQADPLPPQPVTPVASTARAVVVHVPPLASAAGQPIELAAQIDAPFAETLSVRWRELGAREWHEAAFQRSFEGSGWFASLPDVKPPGVEYYIRGKDAEGGEVVHFASQQAPHVVRVLPSMVDRLEEVDRDRLGDRRNQIALDVMGHNFGNRYNLDDRFLRGELAYSRRVLREIHSVTFGFGAIQGETPMTSEPGGEVLDRGLRYGFGEARLRAHRAIFVDVRGTLGASHDGFTGGVRGQLILGKPWRSSVHVGGEFLGDVGGSAWVRLQWDTAPPLLMGASIVRSDLPGAVIGSAGLYIAYDLSYRVADTFTLRGQISYGARDGASHLGGGLGTGVDF